MVSTCVSSPKMSGDPLGVNFNIIKQISPSPTSPQEHENVKDSLQSNSPGLDLSISMDCSEVTVASAVSSEKARIRQQSAMLDKWLMANGGNLYPCREEKEKLAVQMKMTYIQVNRWFANRRRKQTKRVNKVVNSPACVTPLPVPASVAQEVISRVPSPVNKENLLTQITPDMISAFAHALAAQPGKSLEEKRDMVVQQQRENAITPPAIDDPIHNVYHPQVVPDLRNSLVSPFQQHEAAAKLLAASAAGTLPTTGLPSTAQTQLNPLLLAMIQPLAAQQLQSILQVQALQHQIMQHQLQQAALAQAQQQQLEQQQNAQTLWASVSISASPAHVSDSEVSELSELSPLPSSDGVRPHSPPFKDPHQLADKSLLRLLNFNQLSEKEQMAVVVLAGFASMGR